MPNENDLRRDAIVGLLGPIEDSGHHKKATTNQGRDYCQHCYTHWPCFPAALDASKALLAQVEPSIRKALDQDEWSGVNSLLARFKATKDESGATRGVDSGPCTPDNCEAAELLEELADCETRAAAIILKVERLQRERLEQRRLERRAH